MMDASTSPREPSFDDGLALDVQLTLRALLARVAELEARLAEFEEGASAEASVSDRPTETSAVLTVEEIREEPEPSAPPPSPISMKSEPATEPHVGYRLAGNGRLAQDFYVCWLPLAGDPQQNYDTTVPLILEWFGCASDDLVEGEVAEGSWRVTWRELAAPIGPERMWTLSRFDQQDRQGRWRYEVKVARELSRAWFSARLSYEARSIQLAAPRPTINEVPTLVADILHALNAYVDGHRVHGTPEMLASRDVPDVVEDLIRRDRDLPVIIISRVADGSLLVDPDAIARTLAGIARVLLFEEPDTSYALTDAVGRERSVYWGAVRLYNPGFTASSPLYDHPLYLPERVAQHSRRPGGFEAYLLREVVQANARRVPPSGLEKRIWEALAEARRQQIVEVRERAAAELDVGWEEELERLLSEEERLRSENAELGARNQELARLLEEAQASVPPRGDEDLELRSVGEAVEAASERCQRIVILREAFESAWASPYQQPRKIFDALLRMDELAEAYRRNDLPGGLKPAFEQAGLPYKAFISQTAQGRFGRDYERTYKGEKIMLGPHVAFGAGSPVACARIYFYLDEEERTFVVGHIGQHLRDTTTG